MGLRLEKERLRRKLNLEMRVKTTGERWMGRGDGGDRKRRRVEEWLVYWCARSRFMHNLFSCILLATFRYVGINSNPATKRSLIRHLTGPK
jgi:hypothetical protein